MAIKITKKDLCSLINDVVLPFEKYILEDREFSESMKDNAIRANHNIAIAKLSILLLNNFDGAKELFLKGSQAHQDLQITTEKMQKYLSIFFGLHQQWYKKHLKVNDSYEKSIDRFNKILSEAYKYKEADNFLMFDGEDIDEAINTMHYKDERKISAIEYISYKEILDDDIDNMIEFRDELENISYMYDSLDKVYIEKFTEIIFSISNILIKTIEFKDIGFMLNNFGVNLKKLDFGSFTDAKKELIYALLYQMSGDIKTWIKNLFITQGTIDIHYMDASFFANMSQVEIMLEQKSSLENESDDDFLF